MSIKNEIGSYILIGLVATLGIAVILFVYIPSGPSKEEAVTINGRNYITMENKHYFSYGATTESGEKKTFIIKKSKAFFGLKKNQTYKIKYSSTNSGRNVIKSYSKIK